MGDTRNYDILIGSTAGAVSVVDTQKENIEGYEFTGGSFGSRNIGPSPLLGGV